jgi:hypothetical protein
MSRGGFSRQTGAVPDETPQALGAAGVPGSQVPRTVNDGEIARRYAGEGGSQLGGVVLAGEVVGAALQVGTVLLGVAAQLARDRHAQSEELRASTMALVARSCSALKERFPQEASALQGRVSQALRGGAAAVAQLARALISNPNAVLEGAGSQASPTVRPTPPPGSAAARSPSVAAARTDPPRATVARTQAAVAPQAPALSPQDRTAAVPRDSAAELGAQYAVGNAIGNSVVDRLQPRRSDPVQAMRDGYGPDGSGDIYSNHNSVRLSMYRPGTQPLPEMTSAELALRRSDVERELHLEIAGEEARDASLASGQQLRMGGPARSGSRGGRPHRRHGPRPSRPAATLTKFRSDGGSRPAAEPWRRVKDRTVPQRMR